MVSNILPKNMELRPMTEDDIDSILETIRLCDEEEAKTAGEVFEEEDWEGQYVLTEDGIVKGVTGIEYIDGTDNSYWLLRSFLVPQLRERGLASSMTQELLGILNEMEARKVFVNTGDSADAVIAAEYKEEIKCYESLGFKLELSYENYYEPGESRLTYGRRVGPVYSARPLFEPDARGVELVDISEIEETMGAYIIDWDYTDDEETFGVNDVMKEIKRAARREGRCVFVGFPTNLPWVDEVLKDAGFHECGRLIDFYEDGIDEVHYRIDLQQS